MKETKITCDDCGKDLTETGGMPAFRLTLSSEPIPHNTSIVLAILVYPEVKRNRHFCNLACLRNWLADR